MRICRATKEPIEYGDYEQMIVMTTAEQRIKMLKKIESYILDEFCNCPTYENYIGILNVVWYAIEKEIELIVHCEDEEAQGKKTPQKNGDKL